MSTILTSEKPIKRKKGLTTKLVLSMLLVGALPLLIGLFLAFYQGTQKIQEVNGASFEALATETARKIDIVVADELTRTALLTTDVDIVTFLEEQRDALNALSPSASAEVLQQEQARWEAGDPDQAHALTQGPIAEKLKAQIEGTFIDPGHPIPIITRSATRALYMTDIAGRLIASIDHKPSYLHAQEPWWQGAFHKRVGQPYLSPIAFDPQLNTYTFTLALPIMDRLRYEAVGILRRVYDVKEFFAPSIETIRFGKTGHVMLIDSRGVVLSCPILPTGTTLGDPQLIPLVTPMQAGWTSAPSDGHGGQDTSIIGFAPLDNTSRITRASSGVGWHMFVWQSSEELFAPIQQFFQWTAAFGILGVGLLVTLGYLAAHRISAPIRRLQEAARRIGRGEFQEPIVMTTGDEIEELAEEINRMNEQLASQFAGLESQVALKTQEVEYLQESTSQILDSVPDPVIMITPEETIEYLNQASKNVLAITNGNSEGRPFFELLNLDPATQAKLHQEIEAVKHSSLLPIVPKTQEPDTKNLKDPLSQTNWGDTGDTRQELRLNQRTYRYRWFSVHVHPGKDACIGLVLRDSTEESLLQDQLIQGEKLASLGVLSAGIGHELNNPLVGVIGLGEAIQDEDNMENMKGYAKDIVQHGKRMAAIIRDFTGQIGNQFLESKTVIDINAQLTQAINVVKGQFPSESITVNLRLETIPPLRAKPYELGQALTNVLTNAFQAISGTGTIDISTSANEEGIHIRIADTGAGIAPSHLPKVFDPFFTTKGQGEGSGLGLTVAYRIITKLGGQIRLENNPKQGTICHITFPLSVEHPTTRKDDGS